MQPRVLVALSFAGSVLLSPACGKSKGGGSSGPSPHQPTPIVEPPAPPPPGPGPGPGGIPLSDEERTAFLTECRSDYTPAATSIRQVLGAGSCEDAVDKIESVRDVRFEYGTAGLRYLKYAKNLESFTARRVNDLVSADLLAIPSLQRIDVSYSSAVDLGTLAKLPKLKTVLALGIKDVVLPTSVASADLALIDVRGAPSQGGCPLAADKGRCLTGDVPGQELSFGIACNDYGDGAPTSDPLAENDRLAVVHLKHAHGIAKCDELWEDLTRSPRLDLAKAGLKRVPTFARSFKDIDASGNRIEVTEDLVYETRIERLDLRGNPLLQGLCPMRQARQACVLDQPFGVQPFAAWCRAKPQMSPTGPYADVIDQLLVAAGTTDCDAAQAALGTRKELALNASAGPGLGPVAALSQLEALKVTTGTPADLELLPLLAQLRSLELPTVFRVDVGAIGRLTRLERLSIDGGFLTDHDGPELVSLKGLEGATKLRVLALPYVGVKDLAPLGGLVALEELDLSGNRIEDVGPLARLTALTSLNLKLNAIKDVAPLRALTKLAKLELLGNTLARPVCPVFDPEDRICGNIRPFSFKYWCARPGLAPETRRTVDALLSIAGTTDCAAAEDVLEQRAHLDLSAAA